MHGPLRGTSWTPEALSLTQPPSPAGFHRQTLQGLLFLALKPWDGTCCGAGSPRSTGSTSTAKIAHLIFIHHTCVWDQLGLRLCPACQSHCGFFNFLASGLLFSQMSGGCERWWLCSFHRCGGERSRALRYLCHHLDQKPCVFLLSEYQGWVLAPTF